ncbi:AraC family transcriptional regulator [Planctomicrobium sp.]|jgi:AraC-like DNA-binding protein|nr:helix-turn-helix domain-containing protein [Planctomicrobium sp.]MDB4743702.1 AraC family transcriptional regulator [Planctomicrobium sp.]
MNTALDQVGRMDKELFDSAQRLRFQNEFYEEMGGRQQFQLLFEHIPGIYFFVKDLQSRMVCASQPIIERLGLSDELDIVGTTDYHYFPKHVADRFVEDDQEVFRTGEPIINRVEIWYNDQRLLDWFRTTKLPVVNSKNEVIGVMGTLSTYEGHRQSILPYSQIDNVVNYIRDHHRRKLSVVELAEHAGISARQLHRRFQDVFGMNVQEFVNKTRIQAACDELLNSDHSIAKIALEFGFCDQSAFTQQFKKQLGTTPHKFRKQQE